METVEHFASGFKKKSIFIKINRHKRRMRKKINQLHLKQGDIKQRVLHPERWTQAAETKPLHPSPYLEECFSPLLLILCFLSWTYVLLLMEKS